MTWHRIDQAGPPPPGTWCAVIAGSEQYLSALYDEDGVWTFDVRGMEGEDLERTVYAYMPIPDPPAEIANGWEEWITAREAELRIEDLVALLHTAMEEWEALALQSPEAAISAVSMALIAACAVLGVDADHQVEVAETLMMHLARAMEAGSEVQDVKPS